MMYRNPTNLLDGDLIVQWSSSFRITNSDYRSRRADMQYADFGGIDLSCGHNTQPYMEQPNGLERPSLLNSSYIPFVDFTGYKENSAERFVGAHARVHDFADMPTEAFSISVLVRVDPTHMESDCLFSYFATTSKQFSLCFPADPSSSSPVRLSSNMRGQFGATTFDFPNSPAGHVATGEWVHVVLSWASSDGVPRLWINGA